MKILRFDDDRVGVLAGEIVVDISDLITHRAERRPHGVMEELIGSFDAYRPGIAALVERGRGPALTDVTLLSPLPRPSRVLAAFVNYVYGPDKGADALPMEFFHKSPYLVGPGGTVESARYRWRRRPPGGGRARLRDRQAGQQGARGGCTGTCVRLRAVPRRRRARPHPQEPVPAQGPGDVRGLRAVDHDGRRDRRPASIFGCAPGSAVRRARTIRPV